MKRCAALIVLVLPLVLTGAAMACPLCKDSVANGSGSANFGGFGNTPTDGNLSAGFNTSIYYMLSGLFAVMAFIGWKMYSSVRRPTAGTPHPAPAKARN